MGKKIVLIAGQIKQKIWKQYVYNIKKILTLLRLSLMKSKRSVNFLSKIVVDGNDDFSLK